MTVNQSKISVSHNSYDKKTNSLQFNVWQMPDE